MLIFGTWAIISPFFINSSFFCIDSKVTHLRERERERERGNLDLLPVVPSTINSKFKKN